MTDAFEAEVLPHLDALYRAALALLRNRSDAEDVVQETCLQAIRSFHRYTPGTNCRAWLFGILFRVISRYRRKWFRPLPFARRIEAAPYSTGSDVLDALRTLPREFAEVMMLTDVEEFTYKEVAAMLGIPAGTVMSRLSRARRMLRELLGPR